MKFNLEYEYNTDIENYKEKIRELENKITGLEKFIATFEEKVNNIMINSPKNGFVDSKKLLNDRLLVVEYDNRLKSISNQQQYLYVDSKVIKDEIINLWSIKDDSNSVNDEINVEENYDLEEEVNDNSDDIIVMDEPEEILEVPVEVIDEIKDEKVEDVDSDEDYDIFEDSDNPFIEM